MSNEPPQFPAGEYVPPQAYSAELQAELVEQLRAVPARARQLVSDLSNEQLDTKYRNWSIRQIIHHVADSHINSYVRFRWTLTEQTPVIKSYDESLWNEAEDAKSASLECSLELLNGLHARWCEMIVRLTPAQMERGFFHPELDKVVTLVDALPMYVWHSNHHLAQIEWVRSQHGW